MTITSYRTARGTTSNADVTVTPGSPSTIPVMADASRQPMRFTLDERGTLYLIEASPNKFTLLDEKKVSDQECWGHLAVSGDEVFVRELKGVAAWRWK